MDDIFVGAVTIDKYYFGILPQGPIGADAGQRFS
jgi:hypothetical protein